MKEQRWELRYRVLSKDGWEDRVCYPRTEEQKNDKNS
jgi:hypothetical protein